VHVPHKDKFAMATMNVKLVTTVNLGMMLVKQNIQQLMAISYFAWVGSVWRVLRLIWVHVPHKDKFAMATMNVKHHRDGVFPNLARMDVLWRGSL